MIAITVTQIVKDLNISLFKNGVVGEIKELKAIPKRFFSPTYFNGQRTDGYHTLDVSIHEADGFYEVVEPVFDSTTHYLGVIFFDVDKFTYTVIAYTQAELDANTERELLNDEASQFFNNRKLEGEQYIEKFNAWVFRKVFNSEITKPQAITTLGFFYEALTPLVFGYFEEAKTRITALTTANAGLNTIKTKILNEIQSYLDNE